MHQQLDTLKTGFLAFLSWVSAALTWEVAGSVMGILVACSSLILTWCWIIYVRKKTYYLDQRNREEAEDVG